MSNLTDRLRQFHANTPVWDGESRAVLLACATERDQLRVQCKMLQDDKAALMSARDVQDAALSVLRNDFRELANERDALREQLTLLQKSKAPTDP